MKQYLPQGFKPPHLLSGMPKDTPILVALSGGADSSLLLFLLAQYAEQNGTPLAVAHVDHKLRGTDSDRDREFCRALAAQYDIPFYLLEADVKTMAQQHGRSVEEEARCVRYDFFASLMKKHGFPILATAHNADDNAETVLFHLARGSGLHGLCGIPATRSFESGLVIRPLLGVTKQTVLDTCRNQNIKYVTDKTNDDVTYARNRIRHRVLTELTAVNSGATENISRLCASLQQDEDYITDAVAQFLAQHEAESALPLDALNGAHPAIASRAVACLLSRLTDDVRAVHIESVLALARAAVPHACVHLSDGVAASVEDGKLIIGALIPSSVVPPFRYPLAMGETYLPESDMLVVAQPARDSLKNQKTLKNIYKKSTTTRISSDKIYGSLSLRQRQEGDKILTCGMHKSVKKLMCDRKIPLALRTRLPLLADDNGILWIPSVALRDGAADGEHTLTVTLYYND